MKRTLLDTAAGLGLAATALVNAGCGMRGRDGAEGKQDADGSTGQRSTTGAEGAEGAKGLPGRRP